MENGENLATPTTSYYILNMFISFPYEHNLSNNILVLLVLSLLFGVHMRAKRKMENLNFQKYKKSPKTKENEDNDEDDDDGNCVYVINKFSIERGSFSSLYPKNKHHT